MATSFIEPPDMNTVDPAAPEDQPGLDAMDLGDATLGRIIASEAIFVTDERQRVRAWSNEAQRMLGYGPAEVVGQTCYKVMMGRRPDGHQRNELRRRGQYVPARGVLVPGVSLAGIPSPYPYALMLPQSETEALFAGRLAANGGSIHRGVSARRGSTRQRHPWRRPRSGPAA